MIEVYNETDQDYLDAVDQWQTEQASRLAKIKHQTGHKITRFAPQPGFQYNCMASRADITFSGGSAGCGKSFYILGEPLRHVRNPLMRAAFFRKSNKQIIQPGGLWDTAKTMYPKFGGTPREGQYLDYRFQSGFNISFNHMALDAHAEAWQGAQIPLTLWDELAHIKERHFIYVAVSRGRSVSGVPNYHHATMNPPDPDHWIRTNWVGWYIDEEGWPIPERQGVLRYFIRDGDDMIWGDNPEQLLEKYPSKKLIHVKSFTLICGVLDDNQILKNLDPAYEGNIEALPYVERMRLKGNWNVSSKSGDFFKEHYFHIIDRLPDDIANSIRHWDFAATEPSEENKDPDHTRGVYMAETRSGDIIVIDVKGGQLSAGAVRKMIFQTIDGDILQHQTTRLRYTAGFEREPASSGKAVVEDYSKECSNKGVKSWIHRPSESKESRASLVSSHAYSRGIYLLRGDWNKSFINECKAFPHGAHDDQVDAFSGGYIFLKTNKVRDLGGY